MTPSNALLGLLMPVVRFAMRNGLRHRDVADILKDAFVAEARRALGKDASASSIAAATGLQRRDAVRTAEPKTRSHATPLARILSLWPESQMLPQADAEALVREVTLDMHPRALLNELARLGAIEAADEGWRLMRRALIASASDEMLLEYFTRNGADHLAGAEANLAAAPAPGPHYERAVHFSGLSEHAVSAVLGEARATSDALLEEVRRGAELRQSSTGTVRFRIGIYFFHEDQGQ